jgi:hypothetical protein
MIFDNVYCMARTTLTFHQLRLLEQFYENGMCIKHLSEYFEKDRSTIFRNVKKLGFRRLRDKCPKCRQNVILDP